jgi:glycerophosphoryl diester phosphodiesterase
MPSLAEILAAFPDRPFPINVKSNVSDEGLKLGSFLNELPAKRRATTFKNMIARRTCT